MTRIKKILAGTVMLGVLMPVAAFAQTPTNVQALLEQIKSLQAQMKALQEQQQSLAQQQKTLMQDQKTAIVDLARALRQGSTGEDVTALQALLAADPSIYPEGTISGYYGRLTAEAVKRFQKKHGIEQAGFVGPKTLKKLNEFLREHPLAWQNGTSTSATSTSARAHGRLCAIVPPGHLIAPGWLRKHGGERPEIPECQRQNLPKGIEDKMDDDDTDREERGKDKTAPVISAVGSTNLTTTGATINWTTNESATDKIEYGTTASYGSTTAPMFALAGAHSTNLTGLLPSMVYHYRVMSTDIRGNVATSSDMTFTTLTPDSTAPVISAVSASPIGSTTATILWTTNEAANGKVYYSTVSPVDMNTAPSMVNAAYTLAHSFNLTGLTASTTYYYVVESKDGSNNAASSSASFVTIN